MTLARKIRVAAAAYPVERLPDMDALATKLERWVAEAAGAGGELLVFPEYGGMDAALIGAPDVIGTAEACEAAARAAPALAELHADLARRYRVHILGGSLPTRAEGRLVNRTTFHTPDGRMGWQDKQVLTPWEEQNTDLEPGDPLTTFDTEFGRIGVLICYDSEFPAQAEALAVDLLLIPSCTEALTGHSRVHIAARARALEGQRVTVLSQTVGPVPGCEIMDENTGAAGLFGPPDRPFPPSGIIAAGLLNRPGWVIGDVDPAAIAQTRASGGVALLRHWPHAQQRAEAATQRALAPNRP
ncbi:carbon-nitrogen hydrolase family protein [Tropicimonas aquimaris]|uniref:Carbon-nitrogen hydrolase family protein n=1 Tax=Tropicimonas aquimaris TaxID=914152 RepID=A0ABW3IJC2_9RHOB